MGTNIFNGNF